MSRVQKMVNSQVSQPGRRSVKLMRRRRRRRIRHKVPIRNGRFPQPLGRLRVVEHQF
jgi:hypothetical protein